METCACLRLLARLHYIMGDYAEVGLRHPLGCGSKGLASCWGMGSEGAPGGGVGGVQGDPRKLIVLPRPPLAPPLCNCVLGRAQEPPVLW